ncbi:MAG: hypothetical protein IPP83_04265 [Flavobacteriales bacterium]|nr:hypothetical protein [Flavobacteriales bacterium]
MNPRPTVLWVFACTVLLVAGCAKDEGPVIVQDTIDTAYFNTEVLPIFTLHCWNCHPVSGALDLGASEASPGVSQAYVNLVSVVTTGYAPHVRIVPGDPDASVLWQKVTGTGTYGLNMPPNGTTLSAEELQTIRDWIEQGALNN